jgi:PAS domain S-box-containing protein
MVIVGMANGYNNRLEQLNTKAIEDIKSVVAQLSHLAEYAVRTDPQLLYDDISQRATDQRVDAAISSDQSGNILFATNFSWRNQNILNTLPIISESIIKQALEQSSAVMRQKGDHILAVMSFTMPARSGQIRGHEKGLITVLFDLGREKDHLFENVLKERSPEVIIALFTFLISMWLMNRYVAGPLACLRAASQQITAGKFENALIPQGPIELKDMTRAFNHMSESLDENIQKLEKQGKHTQAILDNVVDGILTIYQNGVIISCNSAAEDIFEYSQNELVGTSIEGLLPDLILEPSQHTMQDSLAYLASKKSGSDTQLDGLRKSNECFPLELGLAEIKMYNQKLYVAVVRDISERKKIERMKSEFISTVSHELRTPLTVINGAIAMIGSGALLTEIPSNVKDLLEAAQRNSDRLLLLINDLLDMEKIIAGKMNIEMLSVDIDNILDEAIRENEIYGKERDIDLSKACTLENTLVNVDMRRLNQVISNLLSNAFKFSATGGKVELGASLNEAGVRIFIRDYGEGIPTEFHDQIFEKFSQADSSSTRNKGGTGLGLAISKDLVQCMGGTIGFESEIDHGSIFYIDLPVIEAKQDRPLRA